MAGKTYISTLAPESPGLPGRWLVLALVALDYFTLYVHRNLINYVQPPMKADLDLSDTEIGMLRWVFDLPYAIVSLGVGYLGDRYSRRLVLLVSLLGSSLALAATGLVRDFAGLIAIRTVMGMLQAASFPSLVGTIADAFSPKARSTAMGIFLASYSMALVVAGGFGGIIADTSIWNVTSALATDNRLKIAGWRMAMFAFAVLGGLAALLILVLFREPPRTEWRAGAGLGQAGASFVKTLAAVTAVPSFWVMGAVFLLGGMVIAGVQFWSARYFHDHFGLSLQGAGLQATIWIQTASIAGLLVGGRLGDQWARRALGGRSRVQIVGLSGAAPALVVFTTTASWLAIAAAMLVYGFGVGLFQANLLPATLEVVDPAARSTAVGLLNVISGGLGSWFTPMIGAIHPKLGGLGTTLAASSLFMAVSVALLIVYIRVLLPRDYRAPKPEL